MIPKALTAILSQKHEILIFMDKICAHFYGSETSLSV
jgi:hypothetical protein